MYKNRSYRSKLNHIAGNKLPTNLSMGLYCSNCGKNNHSLLACTDPNNSYGLLCFYKIPGETNTSPNDTKVLMIRRKHTIPYIDFLRGKYDVNNMQYLIELFAKMTYSEITQIVSTCNFNELRHNLGLNNNRSKQYKSEYETSELKFNYILKLGILHKVIICINKIFNTNLTITYELNFDIDSAKVLLDYSAIISSQINEITHQTGKAPTLYTDPEWGLPKGKREDRESDLQTAMREFCEETGLQMNNLRIYKNVIPLEEQYTGMNNITYKHTYFVAELINISPDMVAKLCNGYIISSSDSQEQKTEISKIMLLTQTDALNCIRSFHTSKKNVVHKAFYIMSQYNTFFY